MILLSHSTGATAGDIIFKTAPNGTADATMTLTERFTIKQDGTLYQNGTNEIYHAGNFGKTQIDALNINADTVDTLHASSFLRSDADDSFTGDTLTLDGANLIIETNNGEGTKYLKFDNQNTGVYDF